MLVSTEKEKRCYSVRCQRVIGFTSTIKQAYSAFSLKIMGIYFFQLVFQLVFTRPEFKSMVMKYT